MFYCIFFKKNTLYSVLHEHKFKMFLTYGPRREKNCLQRCANNKGADQPVHSRRLISGFVNRLLESIIHRLASREIVIVYLVSVAKQAGLNPTLSETPTTGFNETMSYDIYIAFK